MKKNTVIIFIALIATLYSCKKKEVVQNLVIEGIYSYYNTDWKNSQNGPRLNCLTISKLNGDTVFFNFEESDDFKAVYTSYNQVDIVPYQKSYQMGSHYEVFTVTGNCKIGDSLAIYKNEKYGGSNWNFYLTAYDRSKSNLSGQYSNSNSTLNLTTSGTTCYLEIETPEYHFDSVQLNVDNCMPLRTISSQGTVSCLYIYDIKNDSTVYTGICLQPLVNSLYLSISRGTGVNPIYETLIFPR